MAPREEAKERSVVGVSLGGEGGWRGRRRKREQKRRGDRVGACLHGDATDVSAWCTVHAERSSSAVSVVYVNTDGGRVAAALAEDGQGREREQGCRDKTRLAKASAGLPAPPSTTSSAVSRTPISPRSLAHRCWQTIPVPIKPSVCVDSKYIISHCFTDLPLLATSTHGDTGPPGGGGSGGTSSDPFLLYHALNSPYTLHIASYHPELCLNMCPAGGVR